MKRKAAPHEATAYHEAGHAVLAIATGVMRLDGPIELGSVKAHILTTAREDRIQVWTEQGGTEAAWNELIAIVAAAGPEAESHYLRETGHTVDKRRLSRGAHDDMAVVKVLFGEGAWDRYRKQADGQISRPEIWHAIKTLAAKLLHCWPEPLSAEEAHRSVRSIDPGQPRISFERHDHCGDGLGEV